MSSTPVLFAQILSFLRTGEITKLSEKVICLEEKMKMSNEELDFCIEALLDRPRAVKGEEATIPAIVVSTDKVLPKKRIGALKWSEFTAQCALIRRTNSDMEKLIEEEPLEEIAALHKAWLRSCIPKVQPTTAWGDQEPSYLLPSSSIGLWSSSDSVWAPRPDEVDFAPYDWSDAASEVSAFSEYESCLSVASSSGYESANQYFS